MKKTITTHTQTKAWLQTLVDANIPHKISLTSNSTTVEVKLNGKIYKTFISEKKLDFASLGFISKTKRDANNCDIEEMPISRPEYFKFFKKQEGTFSNAVEVDVNSAYWDIAYLKGYISKDVYEEGLGVDKMTRIVALGSIATVKVHYNFINGRYESEEQETVNLKTRSYFFDVASELGRMMGECLEEIGQYNCFFYWVDAFFVSKAAADRIKRYFDLQGLGVKYKPIQKIVCKKSSQGWAVEVYEQKNGEIFKKPFFFPFGDGRKELIARTRNLVKEGANRVSMG